MTKLLFCKYCISTHSYICIYILYDLPSYIYLYIYKFIHYKCVGMYIYICRPWPFLLIFKSYIFVYYYINIYLHLPLQNLLRIAIPFTPTITSLYNLYILLYILVVFIICLSNYFSPTLLYF